MRRGKASPKTSRAKNGPSQLKANVELRHRFRFVSTSGTATGLTGNSILGAAGAIGTATNSTVQTISNSFKINQISIWSPPASQGSNVTCSVDWTGFNNTPNREFSDTSVSVATPAYLVCSPPPQSLASFWQLSGTTQLCSIVAPTGSIIDVQLSLILADGSDAGVTVAVATAVIGTMYYLSLDPAAQHRFTPVSLTTTF